MKPYYTRSMHPQFYREVLNYVSKSTVSMTGIRLTFQYLSVFVSTLK